MYLVNIRLTTTFVQSKKAHLRKSIFVKHIQHHNVIINNGRSAWAAATNTSINTTYIRAKHIGQTFTLNSLNVDD